MSWAKGKRVFQRLGGKEKCVVARVARKWKWFFAVRIERSFGGICAVAVVEWGDVLEGNVVLDE